MGSLIRTGSLQWLNAVGDDPCAHLLLQRPDSRVLVDRDLGIRHLGSQALFFKLRPLEDADLRGRLMAMAARAGSPVRGVYTMDLSRRTKAANAMFTGIGPTKRIILGDTLLNEYSADEIETVLAHELAHQVHGDLWRGIAFQAVLTVAGLAVASVLLLLMSGIILGLLWRLVRRDPAEAR